jgi:hypothetical protein
LCARDPHAPSSREFEELRAREESRFWLTLRGRRAWRCAIRHAPFYIGM